MGKNGVRAIPQGYHTVTPAITVRGGVEAIEFYKKAFGAVEEMRMVGPDGRIVASTIVNGRAAAVILTR